MTCDLAYSGIEDCWWKLNPLTSSIPAVWSLCSWVYKTASKRVMPARKTCWRKSGPVSMMKLFPPISICIETRSRLSRSSVDLHTAHPQAIIGIPCEVPVPKNVTLVGDMGLFC